MVLLLIGQAAPAPVTPIRVHIMKKGKTCGDTHLWHVWHGTMPIEAFRDLRTRFCSEFGMESMPSMKAVRSFTNNPKPELLDSTMLLHQKSEIGNEKILYYLLAKYREPTSFEDFAYLSQCSIKCSQICN